MSRIFVLGRLRTWNKYASSTAQCYNFSPTQHTWSKYLSGRVRLVPRKAPPWPTQPVTSAHVISWICTNTRIHLYIRKFVVQISLRIKKCYNMLTLINNPERTLKYLHAHKTRMHHCINTNTSAVHETDVGTVHTWNLQNFRGIS